MSVSVKIPTPLRSLTDGKAEVPIEAATVGEALERLSTEFAGFGDRVFDDNREVRRFINVFVNQDNIRDRDNLGTEVRPGDTISILPSIAGG
jgi:molybdopterin synthase sulfur carrier subunit